MAYDEELAERVRELIAGAAGLAEQKMFGGLAFLVGGHMAIAASGQGGLLVHVERAEGERLIASGAAEPMVMRGKEMAGWLRVSSDAVATKKQLSAWVKRGVAYAETLPPKRR